MEHIHNCETPFYSDCPACRIEKAAPDLLEACKALVEYVEQEHDSLGDFAYFSRPVCVKAKDAIAKAENF